MISTIILCSAWGNNVFTLFFLTNCPKLENIDFTIKDNLKKKLSRIRKLW